MTLDDCILNQSLLYIKCYAARRPAEDYLLWEHERMRQ